MDEPYYQLEDGGYGPGMKVPHLDQSGKLIEMFEEEEPEDFDDDDTPKSKSKAPPKQASQTGDAKKGDAKATGGAAKKDEKSAPPKK